MADEIPFPPQVERNHLLSSMKDAISEAEQQVRDMTPDVLHFIDLFNRTMKEKIYGERAPFVGKLVESSGSLAFIRECDALGKELFGELWNREIGLSLLANICVDMAFQTRCMGCLLNDHEPRLHVVEDEAKPEPTE